jgi:coproporphyrinogen III oxidase-like Fe-S oxidoreductase
MSVRNAVALTPDLINHHIKNFIFLRMITHLTIQGILQILSKLRSLVGISEDAEVTLEMDPGTFDMEKLLQLRAAGITRLSLGVQSFDKDVLKKCGRAHTVEDVDRALKLVMSSDFKDNFSVDLISSLPGLSVGLWQETLQKAAGSGCSHISVYDLQIEDKTAFGRWYSPGVFPLPTDEQSALMYCRASEILKTFGYEHYEVSNYAKPGKRSHHNQRYWGCKATWGFGMGAASFIKNNRFTRPDRMIDYTEWLQQLELKGFTNSTVVAEDKDFDDEPNSTTDKLPVDYGDDSELFLSAGIVSPPGSADILEVVMLALRTSDGLDLERLGSQYGPVSVEKVLTAVRPFVDKGLISLKSKGNTNSSPSTSNICLTDPQGFLLSNDIISSVFVELTC